MRRIFFIGSFGLGQEYGIGRYFESLRDEALNYPNFLELISVNFAITDELKSTTVLRSANITNITIPIIQGDIHVFQDTLLISGIVNLLKFHFNVNETDVFHFNSISTTALAERIKQKIGPRIVYTSHIAIWREYFLSYDDFKSNWTKKELNDQKWKYLLLEYNICEISDKIICLSKENLDSFLEVFCFEKEKVVHISNGLPIIPPIAREKTNINSKFFNLNKTRLLYCGRLDKEKGLNELIGALSLVICENDSFDCLVVGGGDISNLISEYPDLWKNIRFTGYIRNRALLEEIYHEADIVIIPTRYEQSSFVALEALQHSKALILSDIPAFEEINESCCVKVSLNSSPDEKSMEQELAENIRFLMENTAVIDRIGQDGNRLFKSVFNIKEKFRSIVENAYNVKLIP